MQRLRFRSGLGSSSKRCSSTSHDVSAKYAAHSGVSAKCWSDLTDSVCTTARRDSYGQVVIHIKTPVHQLIDPLLRSFVQLRCRRFIARWGERRVLRHHVEQSEVIGGGSEPLLGKRSVRSVGRGRAGMSLRIHVLQRCPEGAQVASLVQI